MFFVNYYVFTALRAQFLMECLEDLRKNLTKRGLNLFIKHGKPEDVLPSLAKDFAAHTVEFFCQKKSNSIYFFAVVSLRRSTANNVQIPV